MYLKTSTQAPLQEERWKGEEGEKGEKMKGRKGEKGKRWKGETVKGYLMMKTPLVYSTLWARDKILGVLSKTRGGKEVAILRTAM